MVMNSSIKEVAQLVLQVQHQHRRQGWTLSTELGDSLLLGGGAAPLLRLDGRTHRDGVRAAGTSESGVVSQPRALDLTLHAFTHKNAWKPARFGEF